MNAKAPILLETLIDDPGEVEGIFARNAPYTPLGGWFRPDRDGDEAKSPMWFQKDWVHADFSAQGSDLFFHHPRMLAAAREFYSAEVVVPRTIYVNLMAAISECGPAHTDNPTFRGRDRTNTPMMLLRAMFWSGLFERWYIRQATSVWWMNDVEGGGFRYWPDGPHAAPSRHRQPMANTALLGDNHGMFHQVEPVGPFEGGTLGVPASSELAPLADGSGDWAVTHSGRALFRAPFSDYRASVLWKADIYASEAERVELAEDRLSLAELCRIFNRDLAERDAALRVDLSRIQDPSLPSELAEFYPEATPLAAGKSMFDPN
ncbi:MAG: hypothetical protein P8Q97_12810 [Myxococcota bacterium]|nr:hypothetical protein [Myxococcota bacterium]